MLSTLPSTPVSAMPSPRTRHQSSCDLQSKRHVEVSLLILCQSRSSSLDQLGVSTLSVVHVGRGIENTQQVG